jgi:acyl carrier protein
MSREVLHKILVDLGIDEERLIDEARLFTDLQIDSTEAVEVALSLKKAFGVSVKLDGASDPRIVDLCAVVDGAVARQRAPLAVGAAE